MQPFLDLGWDPGKTISICCLHSPFWPEELLNLKRDLSDSSSSSCSILAWILEMCCEERPLLLHRRWGPAPEGRACGIPGWWLVLG